MNEMALVEKTLFSTEDKVAKAIERLKHFEPPEGYYLAFSGGKDSVVIKALADMGGVKYDAHYNVTTIDPPEVVQFIKDVHPDVVFDQPEKPFLAKLVTTGFPLRQARWCCAVYKEGGGDGRFVVLGLRWAESQGRRKRRYIETCTKHSRRLISPIIDWEDADVWEFVKGEDLPVCSLYAEGLTRLGCIFCPMKSATQRASEVARWPKYENAFRSAFRRLYANRKARGMESVDRWADGDEMFDWWLTGKGNTNDIEGCFNWND